MTSKRMKAIDAIMYFFIAQFYHVGIKQSNYRIITRINLTNDLSNCFLRRYQKNLKISELQY